MKTLLALALLAMAQITQAHAGTFDIPEKRPLATITVPDKGWKATRIERGIELETPDDEVYVAIEGIKLKATEELATDALKMLMRGGVKVDNASKELKSGTLLGYQFDDLGYTGKDKDGDVVIHVSVLSINATDGILITYWASPKGDKQYEPELKQMIETLKFRK